MPTLFGYTFGRDGIAEQDSHLSDQSKLLLDIPGAHRHPKLLPATDPKRASRQPNPTSTARGLINQLTILRPADLSNHRMGIHGQGSEQGYGIDGGETAGTPAEE